MASVDYLIARSDPNLANTVGAEFQQEGGVTYYNRSFAPELFPGTPILVTRLDMGSLSATEAYIKKVQTMHDAMPSPDVIVSATSAGLGGSNYLMDEVRNPRYRSLFPIQQDYSDLGKASYSNVPEARRLYVSGIAVKTFESWNGIIGSGQGNFEKWFHPSTAGGWNYSRTPAGMACHTDEPTVGGVEGSMYMCNWEAGLLFCECAWSSRNTKYFMAVGDPLVKR